MPAIGNRPELLAAAGPDGYLKLVEHVGGDRLQVPTSIEGRAGQQLAQWVGRECAQSIIDALGGFSVDVPNGRATPNTGPAIQRLVAAGFSDTDIVRKLNVTRFTVRKHRRRAERLSGSTKALSA